jgi:hypothetical protein
MLSSNREAAVRKPGRNQSSHPGQDALLYVGIELPEPLSLTEVTEQMTPTGDLEIDFITLHASVILPGLPRSLTGPGKGPGWSGIEEYASRCGGSARQPMHESAGKGCHPAIPMPPKRRSIHWRPETHGDKSAKPRPPATPEPKLSACHPLSRPNFRQNRLNPGTKRCPPRRRPRRPRSPRRFVA